MKLFSVTAFVSALAMAALSAGAASADCKSTCNTSYSACGESGKGQPQCLEGWRTCKAQCSGVVTPVATSAGAPKGGVMQKAAVKSVTAPAKKAVAKH